MRVVVTGREGQLVRCLVERAAVHPGVEIVPLGRPELDLADPASVGCALERAGGDAIVSAAAYTAVDQAEDEPELAFRVNGESPGQIASAARAAGVPVIHVSTDYVFPGTGNGAHTEDMATGPRNVYGASKLAGEEAVRASGADHLILRTAWVYSPFGRNFVRTMLGLAQTRDEVRVVADQIGNPTSALDISDAILGVLARVRDGDPWQGGTYHFAGTGETSWAGFAEGVFEASRALGGPGARVVPIASAEFPTKASRPRNSRLDSGRFARDFGHCAPAWQESLRPVIARLVGSALPS
jgi:dTDP-4-dehydrorhamnose reductase